MPYQVPWMCWCLRPNGRRVASPPSASSRRWTMLMGWGGSCLPACVRTWLVLSRVLVLGCRDFMNLLSLAAHGPVIPVIVLDRIDDAVPLARALVAGGVRVLEVTLRTAVALQGIAAIAQA